jgi:predicted glycosyltransferase
VRNLPVSVKAFMLSTASLIRRSDLVVATGGYNTITDILDFAKRALVIPRIMHRQEQRIRAKRLAELGILEYLAPEEVTPKLLYSKIRTLLDDPSESVTNARARNLIALDGASRLADFLGTILESQTNLKAGRI